MGTARKNGEKRENLTEEESRALLRIKGVLKDLLGSRLHRLVLFGSKARGDHHGESDIDVAIVVRGLTGEMKKKIYDEVAAVEFEHLVPMSTIVFSEDDFEHLRKRERRIALDIEREGVPI